MPCRSLADFAQLHRCGDPSQFHGRRPERGAVVVVPVTYPGGHVGGLVDQVGSGAVVTGAGSGQGGLNQ
ncbi:hypothetical protein Misp04_17700 [Micromonospora sp. NBRC 101691]|nr:hypothetical protein Misp04_17700 [Micromonospora sp. NBRC 101691]